jgi:alpha-1,2-mannosyltransferase
LIAVIAVLYRAFGFAHLTTLPQWGYDLSFYWTAAQHLIHGEPIYSAAQLAGPYAPQGQDGFLYPPPFAAAMVPFALLTPSGPQTAEWLWSGLGLVILVPAVLSLARSERVADRYPVLRGRGAWLLVAASVAFAPVIGELSIGNVHLVLLGLLTTSWLGLRRGDRQGDWVAGLALGIAAVIKVFPAVLLLWLVIVRRYRAAGAMLVGAAAFAVVMLPITGLEPWRQFPTVLANLSAVTDTTDTISPTAWLSPVIGFALARWGVMAFGLLILVATAWRERRLEVPSLSFAVAVVISVLIAPNVFHHYLAIFVLPFVIALGAGSRLSWLAIAYLLMSAGRQAALGELSWVVNRGLPTAGAILLLIALLQSRSPRTFDVHPEPSRVTAG